MPVTAESLLKRYCGRSIPGLEPGGDRVWPDYGGYSIANIPASICNWLGVTDWPTIPLANEIQQKFDREYRQVILLVMDGMGWELVNRFRDGEKTEDQRWQDLLESGTLFPLTSITPATTAAALVSFWTGRPPSQHGVTGYEMWLREYNLAANMITHQPALFEAWPGSLRYCGFDPESFLGVETLGPFLNRTGVQTRIVQSNAILGSGLSTMLFPRTQQAAIRSFTDLFFTLEQMAVDGVKSRRYLYAYWGGLDELQHVYGPGDERVEQEYRGFQHAFIRFIRNLRDEAPGDTLVLVTADHGLTPTQLNPKYEIRRYPRFLNLLHLLPTGESRLPYLYIRPGQVQTVKDRVDEIWPGEFLTVETEKAVKSGLFGPEPYHPELFSRLGDLVLIPRTEGYLYWQLKENRLLGRHGGLSKAEMLVPLFLFEC